MKDNLKEAYMIAILNNSPLFMAKYKEILEKGYNVNRHGYCFEVIKGSLYKSVLFGSYLDKNKEENEKEFLRLKNLIDSKDEDFMNQVCIHYKQCVKVNLELTDSQMNDLLSLASTLASQRKPSIKRDESVLIGKSGKALTKSGKKIWEEYRSI